MNKKLTDRIKHIALLFGALALITCTANGQDVYEWSGGNGNWNSLKNWTVNGSVPTTLPDENDEVWIRAERNIVINLADNIRVNSLTVQGEASLKTRKTSSIEVNGSIFLDEATSLSKNLNITGKGTNQSAFLSIPKNLESQVLIDRDSRYDKLNAKSAAGSCPFFTIISDPTPPTCNGFSDGIAAVLEPTDGVGPYTYQWVGGPASLQWNNRSAGTYTVIVIDLGQGGLPCNLDVFVNEPGPLTVFSMNTTAPLCADVCNGTATPIVIGGNGGYSYDWSSGESGISASMLCPTFTLEVTDQLGCQFDTIFNFPNVPDTIDFQATISDITCFGDNDGSIDMTVTGGVPPFTFSWSGPNGFNSSSESISNLEPGDYTLQVEDNNNCLADSTFTIVENPILTANLNTIDNICFEGTSGEIDLVVNGGLPPYTFSWTGPNGFTSSDEDLLNLESGVYEVSIEDAGGCIITLQGEIFEPTEIDIDINSTDVLCFEDFNGTATASANGGTPGYTYSWTGPNSFSDAGPGITGLEAGMYYVTVTDANLCTELDSVEVLGVEELLLTLTETPVTCNNGSDGSIDLTINGGTPGYNVNWTGPNGFTSTDEDITGLEPGLYEVTVIDQNGCTTIESLELTNPDALLINGSITDVSCDGGSDGSIEISITGGTPDFSFNWTGPDGFTSSDQDIFNLEEGLFAVDVTDFNGCQVTSAFTVGSADPINADFTTTDVVCFGDATGSIEVSLGGGTPPYSPSWTGPGGFTSSDQNISNLAAGDYNLEITDSNDCLANFTVTINESPEIIIDAVATDASCFGFSNGSIDASVSGGNPGYSFEWVGPNGFDSDQEDISNLEAGTYTLTVTDATNCVATADVEIGEPNEIEIDEAVTDVLCAGDSNGSIEITVNGGVPPFSFSWTGPNGFTSVDEDISSLEAGTYTVEITDDQLCMAQASFEVGETFVLVANATVSNLSCFGANDGSINLELEGGLEPYTINWTGPNGFTASDGTIENLEAGTYNLIASDDNGCTITQSYEVQSPDELLVDISPEDLSCTDANDGSAMATPSGGTPGYNISWSGPNGFSSTAAGISNLEPGNYVVTVTDAENCTAQNSVEILNPSPILIDIAVVQPSCTEDNGSLEALPSGGTAALDYSYSWEDEAGTEISTSASITNLAPGTYTILVTDDNDCTSEQDIDLTRQSIELDPIIADATCLGINDGSINVTPSGGTPAYNFSWTGPNGFVSNDQNISGLQPGDYSVNVSDSQGCSTDETFTVGEPNAIQINPSIVNESCPGSADGSITISISGGTPGYTTSWTGPDGFSANGIILSNLSPGSYTALVEDLNGCQATADFDIEIDSDYAINTSLTNPLCFEEASGSIDLEIDDSSGGVPPYNYDWIGPNGFTSTDQDISDLEAGEYIVIVTDGNNCAQADTIQLTDPQPLDLNTSVTNSNCGQSDGSASVAVTGGTGTISYSWTDQVGNELSTNENLTAVPAGVYNLLVTDENDCSETAVVTITNVNGNVIGEVTNPTCNGGADGMISISVINGTAPYTYEWSDGSSIVSTNDTLMDAESGDYTITVQDVNGCIYTESFEVIEPNPILGNPVTAGVTCAGDDGAINLTVTGGTEPYSISWTGPNGFVGSGASINDLLPGDYTYVIVDANNCTGSQMVTVEFIPDLTADATITDITCGGESTGAIDLNIIDGVPPYDVAWSNSEGILSNDEDLTDLPAGEYTVLVTDDAGCEFSQTYEVAENAPITFDFTISQPDCGISNGSIMVQISGGIISDNYFYTWTDQDGNSLPTQALLNNLDVGLYTLFVSDDLGCSSDTTIALSNPDGEITVNSGDVSCAGASDGFISLDIVDVEEPYAVGWTGPNGFNSVDEDIDNLEPGIYNYFITGNDACTYTGQVEITSPEPIIVVGEVTNTCFGENSGAISISVTGGSPDYIINWTGPDGFTSADIELNNLEPGIYSLEITDQNTCTYNDQFEILENPELTADALITDIACFGDETGEIDLSILGGEAPFDIEWTGPDGFISDQSTIIELNAGDYDVFITDAANCVFQDSYEIAEPDSLEVVENTLSVGCSSPGSLGEISIEVSGGSLPYTVNWTGPDGFTSDELDLTDLESGTYEYLLEDGNGCQITNSIDIQSVEPIEISPASVDVSCNGQTDGSINATISGGMGPYSLDWSGPDGFTSILSELNQLAPGQYILNVNDDAGCSATDTVDIMDPDILQVDLTDLVDATCNTSADGSILIATSGGTAPYEYNWAGPDGFQSSEESLLFIDAGIYNLAITDSRGCQTTTSYEVGFNFIFNASAGTDQDICFSDQPVDFIGSIDGNLGGLPEYQWTSLSGDTLSADSLLTINEEPGTYDFVLTVSSGACSDTDTLSVEILEGPDADAGDEMEVFAEETFTLGGNPTSNSGVAFAWTPNPTLSFDTTLANPSGFLLETTEFTVTVTDANGCVSTDSVFVEVLPEVAVSSGFTPNGDGLNDFWVIDNMELFPNNVVQIFNRWGQVLYEANGYNMSTAWDGKYENKDVPVGTYYYTIELNDPRFPDPITGPLTINR